MEVSVQGLNHPNQDAAGSRDQTFWVLDGATPLFPPVLGGGDVEGTVQRISQHLFLHADRICDLRILLEAAVKEVEQEYRQSLRDFDAIEKYRLPTFACALGRIEKNELSYLILADCEIRTSLGKRFTDPSFAMTSAANRENEKRILKKYGADSFETMAELQRKEALEEFWEMNRKQRMALNTPGGYWVGWHWHCACVLWNGAAAGRRACVCNVGWICTSCGCGSRNSDHYFRRRNEKENQ